MERRKLQLEETGSTTTQDGSSCKPASDQQIISYSLNQTDQSVLDMAAHVVLLFLLLCKGERNGISATLGLSEEERNLPHPESMDNFFVSFKESGSSLHNAKDDVRTLPKVAFRLNDRKANDFDFKDNITRQTGLFKHPESAAKSLIPKHNPELTLNHEKRNHLTNGEVEGVINAHSLEPGSKEEYTLQPELRSETGVGDVLPEQTQSRSKWVTESEDGRSWPYLLRAEPRSRRRRSWLWNQFFVIEEYRGPEPVLIGRVSRCHSPSAC